MRALNRLSAVAVKNLAPGKYPDGGGLWLLKREDGGGQWFLRYTIHGRRREMGLGSTEVSLKDVRESAAQWRTVVRAGKDPIKERDRQKREAERNLHILADIAEDAFEARKAELKGDGKAGRWLSPLELHVLPKLGTLPVAEIDQRDIRDALLPIWHTKADTARKALYRLSICLKHAAALGLEVDLQAIEKARALLGRQRHTATHIPAMPWRHVPAFYESLNDQNSVTHLALRLLILTGMRSSPIRHIHQDQIDGDVWVIPGEALKGRKGVTKDFRVPLSEEALAVIELAEENARDGFLFANPKKGVISDMTMSRYMERAGLEYRPHGFRSSLRDWLAEKTDARHEVAEMMLGHTTGSSVERAYRRTDFIEPRRDLLERWASHVTSRVGKNYRPRVRL